MNYKEEITPVTGAITKWRRAGRVEVRNPYRAIPEIRFYEEERVQYPDGFTTAKEVGFLTEAMKNPENTFNLLNPETGEVIGSSSYQNVYILLFSLYMKLALDRDKGRV